MRKSVTFTADEISQMQLVAHQIRREAEHYDDAYLAALSKTLLKILG